MILWPINVPVISATVDGPDTSKLTQTCGARSAGANAIAVGVPVTSICGMMSDWPNVNMPLKVYGVVASSKSFPATKQRALPALIRIPSAAAVPALRSCP